MALRWWAAHLLAISPQQRHSSLLSRQSPVKMAEPAWNPWKAYSLFWRHPPHSSCLCDPITAVHYPPSTRTRLYVLSANVDSALCSPASGEGSADWCHLKEERKKKNPPRAIGCVHLPALQVTQQSPERVRVGYRKTWSLKPPRNANAFWLAPGDWH